MIHVETLAERILFLKGDVEMAVAQPAETIQDVKAMLLKAAKMEEDSARDYNIWANECSANNDAGTKKIFEQLIADEEGHFENFDGEHDKLVQYGDAYLALQSVEDAAPAHHHGA